MLKKTLFLHWSQSETWIPVKMWLFSWIFLHTNKNERWQPCWICRVHCGVKPTDYNSNTHLRRTLAWLGKLVFAVGEYVTILSVILAAWRLILKEERSYFANTNNKNLLETKKKKKETRMVRYGEDWHRLWMTTWKKSPLISQVTQTKEELIWRCTS